MSALLKQRAVLEQCLDVLLRMIPEYCADSQAEPCTEAEHDAAIAAALTIFHGPNRDYWPPVARAVIKASGDGAHCPASLEFVTQSSGGC